MKLTLVNTADKKLLNAILFFAKNVKYPYLLKILKLVFYLDERHIQDTGKSVTNLDYYALPMGPVATELHDWLRNDKLPDSFKSKIMVNTEVFNNGQSGIKIIGKVTPDLDVFTPRQLRIMNELVEIFENAKSSDMSKATHELDTPWRKAKEIRGNNAKIELEDMLNDSSKVTKEDILHYQSEREEMKTNFQG